MEQITLTMAVKGLLSSKKALVCLFALVIEGAVLLSVKFGVDGEMARDAGWKVASIAGTYLVGQGLADQGKESAKLQAKAPTP